MEGSPRRRSGRGVLAGAGAQVELGEIGHAVRRHVDGPVQVAGLRVFVGAGHELARVALLGFAPAAPALALLVLAVAARAGHAAGIGNPTRADGRRTGVRVAVVAGALVRGHRGHVALRLLRLLHFVLALGHG